MFCRASDLNDFPDTGPPYGPKAASGEPHPSRRVWMASRGERRRGLPTPETESSNSFVFVNKSSCSRRGK